MWEEGVHIYDTPGIPNNFPLEANKITSEIKVRDYDIFLPFFYRTFIHPVHKMVSVLQIIIYNHASNPLK